MHSTSKKVDELLLKLQFRAFILLFS